MDTTSDRPSIETITEFLQELAGKRGTVKDVRVDPQDPDIIEYTLTLRRKLQYVGSTILVQELWKGEFDNVG